MFVNVLQSTLLNVRGGKEQFLPFEMLKIVSAYFVGSLGASGMVPSFVNRVSRACVLTILASFIAAGLVLFLLYLDLIFGRLSD